MPELRNQRWERFAQLIVYGDTVTQKDAYIRAGYKARNNGAEVNASKLLSLTKPVIARVRELQAEQKEALAQRDRFTRDAIAKRMALASQIAEEDRNPSALYGAEAAIAKLYDLVIDQHRDVSDRPDFSKATSLNDIGMQLLQSVGYASPSASDIALALDAHAAFTEQLEAIAERAQGLTSCNQ